jgi:serine/threonine protein phosphatase PrpC
MKKATRKPQWDTSGSCALALITLNQSLLVANVGDSRAIGSYDDGARVVEVTIDHKPSCRNE